MNKYVWLLAAGLCLLATSCGSNPHRNTVYTLTVNSTSPASGVTIGVSPADINNASAGTASFMRTYMPGTVVTLTAPATSGGNAFSSWAGCPSSNSVLCTVTLSADMTVTAAYGAAAALLTPTVTVTPSATSITTAQSVSVTIAVSGGTGNPMPTGSITLMSGSYASPATTLSGGRATITIAAGALATGSDTLTATYTPDTAGAAAYNSATGTSSAVTVTAATTPGLVTPTVTVTPASSTITTSQTLSVTVTVSGGTGNPTPTGSVTLASGSYTSQPATLSSGSATITIAANSLTAGSDALKATYAPDSTGAKTYNSSTGTSSGVTVTGAPIAPTVTVTPSATSISTAQSLNVTVAVSGGTGNPTPTGSITLAGGGYMSQTATLASGSATIAIAAGKLSTGSDTLTATYTPDTPGAATYKATTGTGTVTVTSSTPQPTVTLTASQTSITSGASSTSTWSSTNATSCEASDGWTGAETTSGTQSVKPASTTTYTLTCTGTGGSSANASATVTVTGSSVPSVTLSASPTNIAPGGSSTLTWSSSTNATMCTASGGWLGLKATSGGTQSVTPTSATTTYTLACTGANSGLYASASVTVTATSSTPAPTVMLTASPTSITSGASSALTWSSTNATSCTASGGWSGTQATSGTQSVSPTATTTYTLSCTGAGGSGNASAIASVTGGTPGSGATSVFSYPNGFASASNAIHTAGSARFDGSTIALASPAFGDHQASGAWYETQQNIQAFTTDFTFQIDAASQGAPIQGMTFCVQNTNAANQAPNGFGIGAASDANGIGYAAYTGLAANQTPIYNSVAVKFDISGFGQRNYVTNANATGLYINGGPSIWTSTGLIPENDLNPSGIDLQSGDIMDAHIVYDGSILTMTLLDTVTKAQFRYSWPIDIPAAIGGSDTAWVGFTAGEIPNFNQNLLTWSFWEGYNPELAAPAFSVPAGSYTSAQTVSLSAPSGATIYYTTNGQQPTTSSTQYTGPITVSSSEVIEAIAVETGFTDSAVAAMNYQIAPAGTSLINFPSGFTSASGLITAVGSAQFNGSAIQLTDATNYGEASAAWYAVPVNVQSFTTNFAVQLLHPTSQQIANGLTFTIQNQDPASTDSGSLLVSGGPNTIGNNAGGLGYAGILSSVAVIFDLYDGSGDLTGLYTNGANPVGSSIDMTSSGLSLNSGHPLNVSLSYNGTTLAITIKDTVTNASFSNSWAIDVPATVGGNTAYVGFTASTGGVNALQNVLSWTYGNNE